MSVKNFLKGLYDYGQIFAVEYVLHLAEAFVAISLLSLHVGLVRLSLIFWAGHLAARYVTKALGKSWHDGQLAAEVAAKRSEIIAAAFVANLNKATVPAPKTGAGPYL